MKLDNFFNLIQVDEYSSTPKYVQLSDSIIHAIEEGKLQKDDILEMFLYDDKFNEFTKEKDIYARLQMIHAKIIELMETYHPAHFAIEAPFFGKNVQSMLKLGRAQGVAIAAALNREVPIVEYLPKKVKQSVTGNGNATKEQVAIPPIVPVCAPATVSSSCAITAPEATNKAAITTLNFFITSSLLKKYP